MITLSNMFNQIWHLKLKKENKCHAAFYYIYLMKQKWWIRVKIDEKEICWEIDIVMIDSIKRSLTFRLQDCIQN